MRQLWLLLLMIGLSIPAAAFAQPKITVNITAEKEIVIEENGKEVIKKVEAIDILPGETVSYKLVFLNSGDEAAKGVDIVNRIPTESIYILGSASDPNDSLTFSIDGGESFKRPSRLTYEIALSDGTKEKRIATSEQYTHIRWTIPNIEPKEQGFVTFDIRVK